METVAKEDENLEPGGSKKLQPSDEQMWSALSFAFLLIIIGLPLWWKTTEVPRVSLPTDEIASLTNLKFRINMTIHLATIDKFRGEKIRDDLKKFLDHSKLYDVTWKLHFIPKALLGSCKTLQDVDSKVNHPKLDGNIQLLEVPGLARFTPNSFIIGNKRTVYFSTEADAIILYRALQDYILLEDYLNRTIQHINTPPLSNFDDNTERRVAPSVAYDILFTVLNPEPDKIDLQFDVRNAINTYLTPLVNDLSHIHNIHVKSQWLYFVDLDIRPTVSDDGTFLLPRNRLSHIITSLEKRLGSHISNNPCLNLVLWVPSCKHAPLHVRDVNGESVPGFLSPRWGGIQIINPTKIQCNGSEKIIVYPKATAVMSVFIQQIRLLLGLKSVENDIKQGYIVDDEPIIRVWERDVLLRSRTLEQLSLSRHTLQSLSYLLGVIANIVINDRIGVLIQDALTAMRESEKALMEGYLEIAHNYSKQSFILADSAFSDPSLLQLLYFPEDQKYAVYIPLFLPVMIPVLISLKPLYGWILRKVTKRPA